MKRKRWLWIGVAVLLGLCVLIGVLSNGGKAPPAQVAPSATPQPTTPAQPTATTRPRATALPQPTATATVDEDAWRPALQNYLETTACAPTTDPAYPRPAWCDKILGVGLAIDLLGVRTTATRAEAQEMGPIFSGFAYNNQYKQFGIKRVEIVSDPGGQTLWP